MPEGMLLNIVATECKPDIEEKFNQWYNDIHIPLLLKYEGVKKVTRYKLQGDNPDQAKYLAFYEYASPEALAGMPGSDAFKAAMEEMQESWPDGGIDIKWTAVYEPIKTWER